MLYGDMTGWLCTVVGTLVLFAIPLLGAGSVTLHEVLNGAEKIARPTLSEHASLMSSLSCHALMLKKKINLSRSQEHSRL